MKTKEIKELVNLQIPGERLSEKELVELIKEAEKSQFITLEEHHQKMDKWIQENAR